MEELDFLTDYRPLTTYGRIIVFEHSVAPLVLAINLTNKYVAMSKNTEDDASSYLLATYYRSLEELELLVNIIYNNNFNNETL